MDTQFMKMYPDQYIAIINEIENYVGASVHTDQISKRTIYRLKKLQEATEGDVEIMTIKYLTKKAAFECLAKKKEADSLTTADLERLHAPGAQNTEYSLLKKEIVHAVYLLTEDDSERFTVSAWANGCSDTDIAHVLTGIRGGSLESNRSKVRRFKHTLRKTEQLKALLAAYCR